MRSAGPANSNWRGGRTVTPAGYVLIRLPDHPAADVRGYVYEHRLVMEEKLGRPLRPGERVRRKDNDPSNNDPANLRLTSKARCDDVVSCACGCGVLMTRIDSAGRERRYLSGHNSVRGCRQGARPKSETGSGISKDQRLDLLDRFGGFCAYGCGRPATCWDHVIPWSAGGSFAIAGNTVPACRSCNQRKSACSGEEIWSWIDRGARFGNQEVWMDLISLAVGWGSLDLPAGAACAVVSGG